MAKKRLAGQYLIVAAVAALYIVIVHRMIIPVVIGLLFSLVFRPAYRALNAKTSQRSHFSALLSTIFVTVAFLLPMILIGISLAEEGSRVVEALSQVVEETESEDSNILQIPIFANIYRKMLTFSDISPDEFNERATSVMKNVTEGSGNFLREFAASIPRKIISMFFFLIAFYFGLVDGQKMTEYLRAVLPFNPAEIDRLFGTTTKICEGVVLGALVAGVTQGILIGLTYWILGIPKPLVFGVITVVFSFIPFIGSLPAGLGGTIYLLATNQFGKAIVMGAVWLVASVSDNIARTWVLKGRTQLHPLLGLLSVIGGLQMFGFSGLFLGPIVTALVLVLLPMLQGKSAPSMIEGSTDA